MKSHSIKKFTCAAALVALISTSCGKVRVDVHHEAGKNWNYPETVAVLPFSYDSAIEDGKYTRSILRKTFLNYFSYLGYSDLPLDMVDLKLEPVKISSYGKTFSIILKQFLS